MALSETQVTVVKMLPARTGQYLYRRRKGLPWELFNVEMGGDGWGLCVTVGSHSKRVDDMEGEWADVPA